MKNEDLFKYQEEAMTLLTKAYKKQKFAHAYLLDGENGTGITDAAIYMAKQLICKKDNAPCMECDDCKQIDAKTHLNYIYIEPENDTIRKEQIEKLIHDFSMTSLDGTPQVYIIQSADKMNTSASNALLKFLEEPIPNRYAFLTTNNHSRMLDTIVSRCQMIHFKPIPKEYLVEQLKSFGVESDIAYVISYLTTETDVAMKYIEDGKVLNYLTGDSVYTHQIPRVMPIAKSYILSLYPELTGVGDTVEINSFDDAKAFISEQKKVFGNKLPLSPMGKTDGYSHVDPIEEAVDMISEKTNKKVLKPYKNTK